MLFREIADELAAGAWHAVLAVPSVTGHQERQRLRDAAIEASFLKVELVNATRAGLAARQRSGALDAGPGLWIDAQADALSVLAFTAGPGVRLLAHGGTLHPQWLGFAGDIVLETLDRATLKPAQVEQILIRGASFAALLKDRLPSVLRAGAVRTDPDDVARGCATALPMPSEIAAVGIGIEADGRSGPYLRLLVDQDESVPARRRIRLQPVRADAAPRVHLYEGNGPLLSQARRIATLRADHSTVGDRFTLDVQLGEDGLVEARLTISR